MKCRPLLKTAAVFGGIAGIMTAEQGEPDDLGHMPSMSSKTREIGELQDMYRRTLAASWAAQAGELPADKCIENIFAGGDGWAKEKTSKPVAGAKHRAENETGDSETETRRTHGHHKRNSSTVSRNAENKPRNHERKSSGEEASKGISSSSEKRGQQAQSSSVKGGSLSHPMHEVDEFAAREDLRSWEISANG